LKYNAHRNHAGGKLALSLFHSHRFKTDKHLSTYLLMVGRAGRLQRPTNVKIIL